MAKPATDERELALWERFLRDEARGDSHPEAGQQEESSILLRNLAPRQMPTGREGVLRLWSLKEAALSLLGPAGVQESAVASERIPRKG